MIPTPNTSHTTQALALLVDQFKGRPVIEGILASWTNRVQALENALVAVATARLLAGAVDAQLDSLGDLVGEPRKGRANDIYREAIRLRVKVNRANGKAEDVIQTVNIATLGADFDYREIYPAGFEIEALDLPAPQSTAALIKQTRAAGVKAVLITGTWDSGDYMILDWDGGGVTDPGLMSYTDDTTGDLMAWGADA